MTIVVDGVKTGEVVTVLISGASQSGMVTWGTGLSGAVSVTTASGYNYVTVSGVVGVTSGTGVRISGESVFVYISGGTINASSSGAIVYGVGTSGAQWVYTTSGSYVSVSGIVSVTSGLYFASGIVVVTSISGNVISQSISGASMSGQVVWGTGTSGQVQVQTSSGSYISVSGFVGTSISGGSISGAIVLEAIQTQFVWQSGTGATVLSTNVVTTMPMYLQRVDYIATVGATSSGNLYIYHQTADGNANINLLTLNLSIGSPKTVVWMPDAMPYVVSSGDGVSVQYSNPSSVQFYTRTTLTKRSQ